jgi:ATP adenylyltransferase
MEPRYFFNFDKMAYVGGKRPAGCVLCALGDGSPEVVNLTVADSGRFLVCMNLYPFNPGHILVFPKRHVVTIQELDGEEALDLHRTTCVMLDLLKTTYRAAGFNIGWNLGAAAGASIDHLHQQIIPRYPGEIGIAELIGGQRVLVEDPRRGAERLREAIAADGRLAAVYPRDCP